MKNEEITFKDLSKTQLNTLKEIYIDHRVESMSLLDLKKFAREVLEIQVNGTVGNEEEKEVWEEVKAYFNENFEEKLKEIIKVQETQETTLSPEDEEFKKRLEVLEKRKNEENQAIEDMW